MRFIIQCLFPIWVTVVSASERFELALIESMDPSIFPKAADALSEEAYAVHGRVELSEIEVDSAQVDLQKDSGPVRIPRGQNILNFHVAALVRFNLSEGSQSHLKSAVEHLVQPLIETYGSGALSERFDFFAQVTPDAPRLQIPKYYLVLLKSDLVLFAHEARIHYHDETDRFGIDLISGGKAHFPIQSKVNP